MTASRSNAAPVVLANRRGSGGFRRHGGSLTAVLLGSAVLLSPMAAHAQALNLAGANQTVTDRTGAGNVTNTGGLDAPATLTFDVPAGSFTMTGSILESGLPNQISVIKDGVGTQNLNGASTYSGGTVVNAGVLGFGNNTAFGTGAITLNGGQIAATGSTLTLGNDIIVNADSRILSNNTTLAGTISGNARIEKFTSSILNITGVNSGFTGGFLVGSGSGGGTINVGEATLGAGAIDTLGGALATFTTTSAARVAMYTGTTTATLSNNWVIGGGTLSFEVDDLGDVLTLNGQVSGSQSLWFKNSLGELVLNGDNSGFTGATISDGGILTAGHNNAFGTGAAAIVRINHDTTLKAGAANLVIANRFNVGATGNDILTVDTNGNDMTLSGPINNGTASNKGSLVKVGAGKLTLTSTTSTYSIGTSINGGTLSVSSTSNLGATAPLDFNGGTLQITGTSFSSTTRPITLIGDGGFDIDNAGNTFNLPTVISGAGGIQKYGAGALQLSAANTFTGNSSINAGTLALANAQGFGTAGVVTLAGGELKPTNPGLDLALDVVLSGGGLDTNGNTFTLSGVVSGTSDLSVHGAGDLVFSNSGNTFSGDLLITDGSVEAAADNALGTGAVVLSTGTTLFAGAASVTLGNDILIDDSTIDTRGNVLSLSGAIHDNTGPGVLSKNGSGTLNLLSASDYTGGTNLNAGAINVDSNTALGTGVLTMADATSFGGVAASVYQLDNDIVVNGVATLAANAAQFNLTGNISGAGSLTMSAGYLVLRGINSYTGGTDIAGGYVDVGNDDALGGVGGGTLTLGLNARLGGWNLLVVLPNDVNISGAAAGVYASDLTLSGDITGGTLNVLADNTYLKLTGNNTHASTSIGAGATLIVGADANLGTGALDFAGSGAELEFANATTFTRDMTMSANGNIDTAGFNGGISGAITGAGLLNKVGTGTLTLTNASNSFLALAVSGGQVDVTSEAATGGGTIIMHSGTLGLQGVSSLSNDIQVSAFGPTNTIDGGGAASVALTGVISDINPAGARKLVLTNATEFDIAGANTYTGTLTAQGTNLVLGDPASIGGAGAILELDANATVGSSIATELTIANDVHLINDTGSFVVTATDITFTGNITDQSGNSYLDISGGGIVTFAGAASDWGNGLVFSSGTANVMGGVDPTYTNVNPGGTLAGSGTLDGTVAINNGGILNPGDARIADSINTLSTGNLTLSSGALLNWDFAAPGTSDMVAVNGALTLDGTLNINNLSGFGLGTYTLFTYTPGSLTNNGLSVAPIPSLPGVFFGVDTATTAGVIYLLVSGNITQYWDGANTQPGVVEGGDGTWDAVSTNWTDQTGATNGTWNGLDAVFTAAQGTVDVSGTQGFTSLYFQTNGYILNNGTLDGAAVAVIMADASITTTINSVISGIGTTLDIDYAGSTLNLTGANTFTGDVHVNAGTVGVGNDGALGVGGDVTLGNNTTLVATTPGINLTHNIILAGNATLDSGATGAPNGLNIYGAISGAGGLTKAGASKLLLTQDSSYLGDTDITAGTVLVSTNAAFSTGHLFIADTTGVSTNGANVALDNNISLALGNGFFTAVGSDVFTLNGDIDGTGGFNAGGSGTVVLTSLANSFSGDVFIDTGTLSVGSDANLGDLNNTVTVSNGGRLLFTGSFTSARDVDLGTGGTIDTGANALVLNGDITGGGLTKNGSGTLTIGGDMTGYAGTTTINDGTLSLGSGTGAQLGSALVFNGSGNSTLDVTGNLSSAATVTMNADGNITIGGNALSLTGDISGSGGLFFTGNNPALNTPGSGGLLTLGGDNSGFSGIITIVSGQLSLLTSTAGGTGGIQTQGSIITYANGIDVSTPLDINSNTTQLDVAGTDVATQSGVISETAGPRPLDKIGTGQLNITASNTLSGVFSVREGTVGVGNANTFGTAAASNRLDLKAGTGIQALGSVTIANDVGLSAGTETVDVNGFQFGMSGVIGTSASAGKLNVISTGSVGRLTLSGSNLYAGGTDMTGVIVQISSDSGLGAFSAVAMDNATLENSASIATLRTFTLTNANTFDTMGNDLDLAGAVGGAGSLRKEGAGTLILSATNSYAGGTFIGNGAVQIAADANLGAAGTSVTFDNTGNGQLITTAGIVTSRNIILTANGGIDNTGTLQLDGVVSGSGDLAKNGTGELFLNSTNTNSGAVHIIQGAVRLGTDAAFGNAGAANIVTMDAGTTLIAGVAPVNGGFGRFVSNDMVLGGAVTVDLIGTSLSMNPILSTISTNGAFLALTGDISGAGSLTNINEGGLLLTGVNTYSGGTTFSNGVIGGNNASAFGTGTITLGFNSWFVSGAAAGTNFANDIDLSSTLISIGGAPIVGIGPDTTLSGVISGTNGFDKVGTEVLTLTGTNTYAGATNVGAGTLLVNGSNTGLGAVTVANGATLGGSGTIAGAVSVANGGTIAAGNSPGTLTVGSLSLLGSSVLNYELGDPNVSGGANNDLIIVTNNLTLDGLLTVTDPGTGAGFGLGVYQLMTYGGTLTDNGLTVAALPPTFNGFVQTSINGQVNLVVNAPGVMVQDWQGSETVGDGLNTGGTGTWDASTTNWSSSPWGLNTNWQSGMAVFGGATGTVTVSGTQNFQSMQFATDAYTLTGGTINASTSGYIAVGVANATIDSDITGAALAKQLGGNLNLGGNNSFASLDIQAGSVTAFSNTALGGGAVTMATGTSLIAGGGVTATNAIALTGSTTIDTAANTLTLSGVISGASSTDLNKVGTGTLVLNGTNTYAGVTNLNAGTINLGNAAALSTGTLNMATGTTLQAGGTFTVANAVDLTGSTTVDTNGNDLTLSGVIGGAGATDLNKTGAGILTLTGANTYAGVTNLNAGTLNVGNAAALSTGTLNVAAGTTLQAGGSFTVANAVDLTGTSTIDTNGNALTLSGAIGGTGGFDKTGAGFLTLTGANTYAGATNVNVGTMLVNGTNSGTGLTSVASGASLGGTGTITGAVDVAGGATLFAGLAGSSVGVLTVGDLTLANTSILNFDFGAPNVAGLPDNDLIIVNGNLTLDGVLNVAQSPSGPGFGVGVYELFGYSGTLTDNTLTVNPLPFGLVGTVQSTLIPGLVELLVTNASAYVEYWQGADLVGNGVNDGGSGTWTALSSNWSSPPFGLNTNWQSGVGIFAGATGTVTVVGAHTFQALQFATDAYLLTGGSLDTAGASFIAVGVADATIDSQITGTGSFDKQGAGRLTLGGNNTYAGGTAISGGTIQVMTDTALGTGAVTMANSTTLQAGAIVALANDIAFNGAATLDNQTFDMTLNGVLSGSGAVTKTGSGTLFLTNNSNSYSGGTAVTAGTVDVSADNALGTGSVDLSAGTTLQAGATVVLANNVNLVGSATIGTQANNMTLNGVVAGSGTMTKTGSGMLTLNGNNSYSGGTLLNAGTINVGSNTALGTSSLTMAASTTLQAGTTVALANDVILNGSSTFDTQGFGMTLDGIVSGTGPMVKIGTGTLTLNGNNSYSGPTDLNLGTIAVGSNTGLGTGQLNMADGTTLQAGVSGLVVANAIATLGSGLIDQGAGTFQLDGVISGVGSISTVGTGNLILNGNSTFSGGLGINVSGSTVTLGTNTAAGTAGIAINDGAKLAAGVSGLVVANNIVTTGSGLIDQGSGVMTLNGVIGGVGSISTVGTGELILNGNNTFSGGLGINVAGSTVTLGTNTAAGVSGIALNNGATLKAGVSGLVVANNIVTTGSGLINQGSGVMTLNGVIGGVGSISTVGTGELILNGNNTFSGGLGINVAGSTVTLGTNTAAGVNGIALNNGATLKAGVSGLVVANNIVTTGSGLIDQGSGVMTLNGVIGGVGSISTVGTGELILNGNNTFSGGLGINVAGSTVTLGTNTAAGVSGIALNNGATLKAGVSGLVVANNIVTTGSGLINQGSGVMTLNGVIGGAGSISTVGTGELILNGNNTFSGGLGINVAGSTVTLGTNTAAGVNGIALNNGATLKAGVSGLVVANNIVTTGSGLINQGAGTFQLNGVIGGVGSISTVGTGELILNGNNTFSGGLGINVAGSTVTLGTNTAAGVNGIALNNGATLKAGVSGLVVANNIVTTGSGLINQGSGIFTLNGVIGGAGSISTVGTGELVLNGNNAFTGGLGINVAGSTVTLGTNTAAGVNGIALNNGATLKAGVSGLVVANNIVTTGSGLINQGSGIFTLNGVIGGAGSISTVGTGELVLNGNNTFTGGLGINVAGSTVTLGTNTAAGTSGIALNNGATLKAGVSGLVVANNIVTTGSGLINQGSGVMTLNGTIGGAGSISTVGTGELVLNGNNAFTGGLGINVAGSTVTLGTNTAAGTSGIALNNGATLKAGVSGLVVANNIVTTGSGLINQGSGVMTLNGVIGGAGSISTVGTGELVLNGNNAFTGGLGINVAGSTVTLGTNTAAGVNGIALNNGATLKAGVSGLVVANNIVTTGSGLINQGSGVMTLNGTIGGAGSISTVGTGELVLNGNNAFTGGLGINVAGSTVTLGTNTAAGTSGIALNNGATLKAGAAGLVVANTVITTGAGTIDTQAQTFTLSGPIGGAGSIAKVGAGNLVLTGASTYTGATNVNAGTLSVNGSLGNTAVTVASGATLGGTGSIAGTVTIANGGILAPGNSPGTLSVGALNLNASSVLNWDLGQAYAVGGVYNDLVQVGGNLVLDGLLNVTNSNAFGLGVYQLGTYGGTLTDNGLTINSLPSPYTGTIQTAIAGQVNLLVAGPGVLTQYWDGANTVGNGVIDGGTGTWSVAGTNWTGPVPSGINTNWQGGIAVFAGAAGTATLDAPAAFKGLQFATTGYTIAATGTGGLTNATGAFVYANTGISANIDAVISGAGALDKQGVGTVTLNAANTYTGGTFITDGTLGVGNNAALSTGTLTMSNSAILQAATSGLVLTNNIVISPATGARVDSGSGTFTLNGNISGATGSLSQIGTGNLVLGGNNTFGADLGINQGRVTLMTNTAAGASGIALNNGAVLAAGVSGLVIANNIQTTGGGAIDSGAGTFTINGNIGNLGSISQIGTGNLVLNGNNNFTSGLGINQGTVTLGTNNSAGASFIALNGPGTLAAGVSGLVVSNHIETTGAGKVDSGAGSFTLSGTIGNVGGINKVGTGTLWMTNTSDYLGGTTVSAGTLTLTGALTKSTVTAAGGTFAGTGPAAGIVAASGGKVSPGTAAGAVATMASTGTINFQAGSTYVADVTLVSADKLTSVGATSITGGTVAAQGLNAQYNFNSTYTILTAAGGRTGTFSGITATGFNLAFAPVLSYDANNVYIKLAPQKIVNLPTATGLTSNETAVANAFDAATAAGWNPQSFYALYQQGANLPTALNQLSGEIHSVERRAAIGDQRYVREAALDRLGAGLCSLNGDVKNGTDAKGTAESCNENYSLWGRYVGSWGTNQADGNGSYFKTSVNGIIVGIDAKFNEWKVGGLFFRTTDHVTLDNDLGSSSVQTTGGGAYVGYRMDDGFAFSAGGTYAGTDLRAGRTITAPGLGQTLQTDASGNIGQLFGEIAYDLAAGANARVEPFARLGWVSLSTDAYSEAGGYAALVGDKGTYDTTFTTLGVRGVYNLSGSVEGASLRGSAGWLHTSGDRSPEAIVAITGTNSPASIYGVAFDEDAASLEAGIDYSFGAFRVGVGYVGVLGKNTKDNGVTATLSWGF